MTIFNDNKRIMKKIFVRNKLNTFSRHKNIKKDKYITDDLKFESKEIKNSLI